MNKTGPIIIIEDDPDDQTIINTVFKELDYPNEVIFFEDGRNLIDYLKSSRENPFLVLSDINMPMINGFELRKAIFSDDELRTKCIPYVFFTTGATEKIVKDAYALSVQGFFTKPHSLPEFKDSLRSIVEYWKRCLAPGEYS